MLKRLKQGEIVALISDAGTPGISDPGTELVRLCINENIPVVPVPGPSAVVAAISASGLSTDEFTFGKFCSGTYSCALTVRASFFELFLPYGLPLGSLQLLNMCNVQLDLFLSKLHLEERG